MTRSDKRNLKKSKKRRDRIEAEKRSKRAAAGSMESALHASAAVFGHLMLGSFDYDANDPKDAIQSGAGAAEIAVRRLVDKRIGMGELSDGSNDGCGGLANWMASHCAQMLVIIGRIFGRDAMDEFSGSVAGMFKMCMDDYDSKDEIANKIKVAGAGAGVSVDSETGKISVTNVDTENNCEVDEQ